jgi:hypothetical protein
MNRPIIGQIVGYVTPTTKTEKSKIVDAKVIDVFSDGEIVLDYSDGTPGADNYKERRAIATFNDDKQTENSWFQRDAGPGSAASPAAKKAPAAA